jgi:thioredoxin 1
MHKAAKTTLLTLAVLSLAACGGKKQSSDGGSGASRTTKQDAQTDQSKLSSEAKGMMQQYMAQDKRTAVYFFAKWCPACKKFSPVIDQVSDRVDEEVKLVKVNVDEKKDLTEAANVKNIPVIYLFDENGKLLRVLNGSMDKKRLEAALTK